MTKKYYYLILLWLKLIFNLVFKIWINLKCFNILETLIFLVLEKKLNNSNNNNMQTYIIIYYLISILKY